MKKIIILCLAVWFSRSFAQSSGNKLETICFDNSWRFHLGGFLSAENPDLDDSKWRLVDLPHDWSIENRQGTNSPFERSAISQVNEGFTVQGTGWYRKSFVVPAENRDQITVMQFDGVYMNADVYVNGIHVGNHPYGYTSFFYDITKYLRYGRKNVIAVEVKNEGQNSRWYSGSGIYRHVWLSTLAPVHLAQWGMFINATNVSEHEATLNLKVDVENQSKNSADITLVTHIWSPANVEVAKIISREEIDAGKSKQVIQQKMLSTPTLWSVESPSLYRVKTEVMLNNRLIGAQENSFGIRSIDFSVENGFQLNGKTVKLKGGCFHNDNGPLGSRAYNRAEERKVELLKASGFNAIRCSHNPPSEALLSACDKLGMLVIDEAFDMWNLGKNPYDYHLYFKDWWQKDIESMITRDRNHPSIIMWSIGNEIPEKGTSLGVETAAMLTKFVKSIDATRPVTAAVNDLNPDKDPFFSVLDISGYNYAAGGDHLKPDVYAIDHARVPGRIMVGTESYPLEAFKSWMAVKNNSYVIGDFVWTAFDYIGEASIGWLGYPQTNDFYPWNLAYCGDLDICGWKRPQSYYRDVLWKPDQLSVFVKPPKPSFPLTNKTEAWSKWNWLDVVPEWNWKGYEQSPLQVTVYSSCDKVELFLNGKSLGVKSTNQSTEFLANWMVPYQAGELRAVGYTNNEKKNTSSLYTVERTEKVKLSADKIHLKAGAQDLSYVTVTLCDRKGHVNPSADNLIHFEVSGDAEIVGVANANPVSLESFQLPHRKAWKGKCLVVVKAGQKPGPIQLKATAEGITPAVINLSNE